MAKKQKVCKFCQDKIDEIDYKDIGRIRRYITPRGKIISAKQTGTCSKHQRALAKAIKRARFVGLLPFVKI
ncbi:MAG: 30S ribosomal protein S18 [Candidatus Omnitrophica bacterium]|nr:30S ribosomal protein S18 [Candidatus Omnitrophota bacterium]